MNSALSSDLATFLTKRLGLWVLARLGVFWLLQMALIALVLFWIAKQLLAQGNPRIVLLLVVATACLLEWAEPGHRTYGVPHAWPPTESVVTFTIDERTLPAWAAWIQDQLPGPASDPDVTVPATEPASD
ncbi:MAG: hypothetical protein AAFX01_13880 [Cyanobacteria bacterium J06638_28]